MKNKLLQISTGLDSAVTLDIFKYIKAWCKVTNGTALASLLQAPRDVRIVNLFENEIHLLWVVSISGLCFVR